MNSICLLRDEDGGILCITLFDLLETLKAEEFRWSIQNLTAVAIESSSINVLQLEAETQRTPGGKLVSHNELLDLGRNFHQIIDGLFIAYNDNVKLRKVEDLESAIEFADMAIEYFDSSTIRFFAKDGNYVKKIKQKYPKID